MPIAISLTFGFIAYLICLGAPLARWQVGHDGPTFLFFALSFLVGLAINYVLALLSPSLWVGLVVGAIPAFALGIRCVLSAIRFARLRIPHFIFIGFILGMALLWVGRPVSAWDARSVWFFHAKIIYWAKAVTWTEAWGEPELWWMHAAYPKLFATLAAQVTTVAGYWNDYLPKLALVLLEVPVLLAAIGLGGPGISLGYLAFASFGYLYLSTSSGYMDGFLAQYTTFGIIFLYRWLERRQRIDWALAVCFVTISAGIKGEGVLTIACTCFCLLLFGGASLLKIARRDLVFLIGGGTAGFLVWAMLSKYWNLGRFDPSFTSLYVSRFSFNATNAGSWKLLYANLVIDGRVKGQLLFCLAGLVLVRFREKRLPPALWLFPTWSLGYLGLLSLIYLGTPYPFDWHVVTSAPRTVLVPSLMLAAGAFYAIRRCEK